MNICYRQINLADLSVSFFRWINSVLPSGPCHLLLLSMGKHLGEDAMWGFVDVLNAKHTYLETNALKPEGLVSIPWEHEMARRGGVFSGLVVRVFVLNRPVAPFVCCIQLMFFSSRLT